VFRAFPESVHADLKRVSEPKMKKLMDLLKDKITLPSDLTSYSYLFFDEPVTVKAAGGSGHLPKKIGYIKRLREGMAKLETLNAISFNKLCSKLLYDMYQRDKKEALSQEDFFQTLRLAITGTKKQVANVHPVHLGDVIEILGREKVLERIDDFINMASSAAASDASETAK
jgi:hypothetical protein